MASRLSQRERAASHWVLAPPVDGRDDEDADTGTDTTAPDDDIDHQPAPSQQSFHPHPCGVPNPPDGPARAGARGSLRRQQRQISQSPSLLISSARCTCATLFFKRHRQFRKCALMVAAALPPQTREFTLQVIDLTQGWSNAVADSITHTDLLATVAAVSIYVTLRFTPGQRNLHRLPQLLEAFCSAALAKKPTCRGSTWR